MTYSQTTKDAAREPRCPKTGVVAFVPDTWDSGVWQLRHQILTRLAAYYHVVWLDPPIGWRETLSLDARRGSMTRPDQVSNPGFAVYRHSRLLPKFYRPKFLDRWTERARAGSVIRYLRELGCEEMVGYLWRPDFAGSLDHFEFDRVCYHIDDEYSFSPVEHSVDPHEREIIKSADTVFIHSPGMMEFKGEINKNTVYVPNGVDYPAFSNPVPIPDDHPVSDNLTVGYIGVLKSMVDWQLIYDVANALSDFSFVFVGPEGYLTEEDRGLLRDVQNLDNTSFLGTRQVAELPAYAQHFDICMMPYKRNWYTQFIYPLKVNEYLAAGKPIIGTPIRTLEDYIHVIKLAASSDEWCAAIREYAQEVANPAGAVSDERRALARQFDWSIIVGRVAGAMREAPDPLQVGEQQDGLLPRSLDTNQGSPTDPISAVAARKSGRASVAIGIPVFNGEAFLERTLDSVLAQDYGDFRVHVSDNDSTDATEQICREYAARDSRIEYEKNAENIGVFRNFDRVFERSESDYFKWWAVGDHCEPSFLPEAVKILDEQADCVIVGSRTSLFRDHLNDGVEAEYVMEIAQDDAIDRLRSYLQHYRLNHPFHGLIRSSVLTQTSLNREYASSDVTLIGELMLAGKLHIIPKILFYRRERPDTATARMTPAELEQFFASVRSDPLKRQNLRLESSLLRAITQSSLRLVDKARGLAYLSKRLFWKRSILLSELFARRP